MNLRLKEEATISKSDERKTRENSFVEWEKHVEILSNFEAINYAGKASLPSLPPHARCCVFIFDLKRSRGSENCLKDALSD
jgi:hypothetical protein